MNSFGRILRVQLFGESHGERLGVLVDGCPAGLELGPESLIPALERRRPGRAGTTRRREADAPTIGSGVFEGRTTGAPILIEFENRDADPSAYREIARKPRPGHADLVARQKFGGFNDPRGGGHSSGRLTVGLVAAGAIARKLLPEVRIAARVIEAAARRPWRAVLRLGRGAAGARRLRHPRGQGGRARRGFRLRARAGAGRARRDHQR